MVCRGAGDGGLLEERLLFQGYGPHWDWSRRDSESEPASAMGILSNQPRRDAHLHVQRCGGLCIIGTPFLPGVGVWGKLLDWPL